VAPSTHAAQPALTYDLKPLRASIPVLDELELARNSGILEHFEVDTFWLGTDDVVARF
jgi:hypothetical protein